MRNLKRALSLGLTAAMISGLMVMGSSAASYTDSDEIQNQAAVEILGDIGVMVGNADGTFAPDRDVTRAEMAVIITRILYGENLNVDQFKGMNIFNDVPDWAEGFVNLCASLDIVAGVGEGKFDPNATVTTAQASLMLCRALGYFQNSAEFGNDWALAAIRRATQAGIIGGDMVLTANEGLSRDNVAQMTFNTLTKAVPVQYNELLNVYYNENKGITYALTFYYTDTLGYKNFDLVYRSNDNGDYGRPATTWGTGSYRGTSGTSTSGNDNYGLNEDGSLNPALVKMTSDDEIITVAETPDYIYTSGTKENVVYNAVGRSVVNGYDWEAYVDGTEQTAPVVPANDRDTTYTYTGKGATTEIYVDDVNETVTVVEINYYMAEVTNIREDSTGEYATVRILSDKTDAKSDVVDDRNIYCEGFSEDDYVVVTVDVDDDGDSFIATIDEPETAEGTVTRVKKDSDPEQDQGNYAKLDDGNQYNYSAWTAGDLDDINTVHPTLDIEYRLYLDPNGYVIGFQALEDYYDNYLYVEAVDVSLNTISAKVVFSDGTSAVVEIDDEYIDDKSNTVKFSKDKSIDKDECARLEGNVYAWTESNDVYTLREIVDLDDTRPTTNRYKDTQDQAAGQGKGEDAEGAVNIYNDAAYIKAPNYTYIVDENTAFVDTDERTVYTGFENVPDYIDEKSGDPVKFWAIDSNGDDVVDVIFIYGGEATNSNKTYFYVADTDAYETYEKNKMYKEQDLYIDGEDTALIFNQAAHTEIVGDGLYCVERTNGDGVVTDITPIAVEDTVYAVGSRTFALSADKTKQYTTNSDTIFVVVTYDLKSDKQTYKTAEVTTGALKDLEKDDDYTTTVYVAKTSNSGRTADLVYIVKHERDTTEYTVSVTDNGIKYTLTADGSKIESGDKVLSGAMVELTLSEDAGTGYEYVVTANGTVLGSKEGAYETIHVYRDTNIVITKQAVVLDTIDSTATLTRDGTELTAVVKTAGDVGGNAAFELQVSYNGETWVDYGDVVGDASFSYNTATYTFTVDEADTVRIFRVVVSGTVQYGTDTVTFGAISNSIS